MGAFKIISGEFKLIKRIKEMKPAKLFKQLKKSNEAINYSVI